jgi:hypothetical protein
MTEDIRNLSQSYSEIFPLDNQKEKAALLQPGGIETYVHRGCRPKFIDMNDGYSRLYLPPKEATDDSRMEYDFMSYYCLLDENDQEGTDCTMIFVSSKERKILMERIQRQEFVLLRSLPLLEQARLRFRYALNSVRSRF